MRLSAHLRRHGAREHERATGVTTLVRHSTHLRPLAAQAHCRPGTVCDNGVETPSIHGTEQFRPVFA